MVSSAITGAGSVAVQDTKTGAVSKTKDSGADFSAVLTKSVTSNISDNNKNASAKMNTTVNTKKDSDVKTADKSTSADKTASGSTNDVKKTDTAKDTAKDTVKDNTKQTVSDKADAAGKEVYDEIKEDFGLTDEQLTEAMETLGLTMADLLSQNNITQLVVEVTGIQNAMDIVTDESLSDSLKAVLSVLDNQLNNLAAEADIPVDAVKEILSGDAVTDNAVTFTTAVKNQDTLKTDDKPVEREAVSEVSDSKDTNMNDVIAKKLTVNTQDNDNQTEDKGSGKELFNSKADNATSNVNTVTGNVVNDITNTFETVFEDADTRVSAADVVDQVVESIKLNATSELKSMEIQLNPQNLGKVNLLVSVREGVITAQITAENEQVRKALESQVSILKENIESQGIKVDAVEVSVQTNAFDANQQQFAEQRQAEQNGKAARRIRFDGLGFGDEDEEDDDTVINYNENSSVEFTA